MKKVEMYIFKKCAIEDCKEPGLVRYYSDGKPLCTEHAKIAWTKYMKWLLAAIVVIVPTIIIMAAS